MILADTMLTLRNLGPPLHLMKLGLRSTSFGRPQRLCAVAVLQISQEVGVRRHVTDRAEVIVAGCVAARRFLAAATLHCAVHNSLDQSSP